MTDALELYNMESLYQTVEEILYVSAGFYSNPDHKLNSFLPDSHPKEKKGITYM